MPFNFQSLLRLTADDIVDLQVTAADIASTTFTATQIQDGSIDGNKLASASVNLGTATVTGSLPVNKGGTGLSTVGANYQVLRVNSGASGLEWADVGINSMQVFTSSGTWNRPSGVRYIHVQVVGGGGGGSGHGESGGAGGYSEKIIDVTGTSSVSVTVAGEVGGTYYFGYGAGGQTTSFGAFCSATGGDGANSRNAHCGGLGGVGSGGDLNIYGGGGGSHHHSFGPGGKSYWGGSVAGGHPNAGNFSHNHQSHSAPGSGGRGAYFNSHLGSNGRPGMVVVTEYK